MQAMQQPYKTINGMAEGAFVERRSRFIGYSAHVETEAQAMAFVAQKRDQHWDATHNVFAYLLRSGNLQRCSDDGEPSGTAGKPVLDVLQGAGLLDIVVVVTRYFGGVLLGTGGLTRAYSQGAKMALENASIALMHPGVELSVDLDYGFYGKLTYILPKYQIITRHADFGVIVRLQLCCKEEFLPAFLKETEQLSAATVVPRIESCGFVDFAALGCQN